MKLLLHLRSSPGAMRSALATMLLAVLGLFACCGNASAQDEQPSGYFVPDQSVKVEKVPEVNAAQHCENYALAADLEAMLRQQHAPISQNQIADRIWSGKCLESPPELEQTKHALEGDYVLDDGRHVRVEATFTNSLPTTPEPFLLPLMNGQTYVLYWRQHAYLLVGALWDETVTSGQQKVFHFREFTLLDPFQRGDKRTVTVDVAKDGLSEFGGTFQVKVTEAKPSEWVPPVKW